MELLYIIIIGLATTVGAVCGMGGGVIIKPLLDAISPFSAFQISIISGSCVLVMSVASLVKHKITGTRFCGREVVCFSVGSVFGGVCGDYLYNFIYAKVVSAGGAAGEHCIKIVQNAVLAVLILLVMGYMIFLRKKKCFHVRNIAAMIVTGVVLGIFSTFLDIGGGPINVCVFCFIFGMDVKTAGVNSLVTILFAQLSKFVKMIITESIFSQELFNTIFPWWMLVAMVILAVTGGLLGAVLSRRFSEGTVNIVYCSALGGVFILNVYVIISNMIALIG